MRGGGVGAEGEPTPAPKGGHVGAVGEPTSQTTHMSLVGAESELNREAGDSGGDATSPSSCCRQSLLGGDISFLFLLALVTRGEMTGRVRSGVAAAVAAGAVAGAGMGAGDAVAAGSAAEAFPTSATVAAVASVAARLRSRHLFLRAALLALWALR